MMWRARATCGRLGEAAAEFREMCAPEAGPTVELLPYSATPLLVGLLVRWANGAGRDSASGRRHRPRLERTASGRVRKWCGGGGGE